MTTRKTHLLLNVAASLIAIVMLISASGQLKAYLQSGAQGDGSRLVASAASLQSEQEHSGSAEEPAGGEHAEGGSKEEHSSREQIYHIINFLMLAGAIVYLCKKFLGPFLKERAQAIREDMDRSRRAVEESAQRLAVIENKLKQLDEEIGSMRNSALREAAAERVRIEEMGRADAQKIASNAEQEITAAAKLARQELKVYASELALGLAEKKIQDSISEGTEQGIFRTFVDNLRNGPGTGRRTS